MRARKLDPPGREAKALGQHLQLGVAARRARHALERALSAASGGEEGRAVPDRIRRALAEAEDGRRRDLSRERRLVPMFGRERRPIDWEALRDLIAARSTLLSVDAANFVNPVNEGAVSVWEGDFLQRAAYKTAYGQVGYAYLSGAEAQAWNRSVFGFSSSFSVPAGTHHVKVSSFAALDFVWPKGYLEALSFGRKSWGEVTANVQVEVLAPGTACSSGVQTLLQGSSPRGDWETGDIGVYQPMDETRSRTLTVDFTVQSSGNSPVVISVFELAELIAERHHRVDRCNAVIWGTGTWEPLAVRISPA